MTTTTNEQFVIDAFNRPWEFPDTEWMVRAVIPTGKLSAVWTASPCCYVALLVRIRGGIAETRYPVELGRHESDDDAWDYAEHLCNPMLN